MTNYNDEMRGRVDRKAIIQRERDSSWGASQGLLPATKREAPSLQESGSEPHMRVWQRVKERKDAVFFLEISHARVS